MDPQHLKKLEKEKELWKNCDKCTEEIRTCDIIWFDGAFMACDNCGHYLKDEIKSLICEYFVPKETK